MKQAIKQSLRLLSLAALVAGGMRAQPQAFQPLDPFEQVKIMGRGVNVLGYDPIWDDTARARFHDRHFQLIHDGGFQTIRINLQAFDHMDASNKLSAAWFKTLDWAVKNALANHLQVILDEHDFDICGKQLETCRPKLLAFWEQVSEHYKDAPAGVLFEILNEPNGQLTADAWNRLAKDALAIVRKTNPRRNVVIGPAYWNSIGSLNSLALPAADRNIIVTVHYYMPMNFTHQGASWSPATAKLSGIKWGTDAEKHRVEEDFAGVQQWSKKENRPILLGEFGAYDKGDMDSRVLYTSCVARTAEHLGWAWTYWQFDSDFIVWDMAKDAWVGPIWKALVP
jgi:endoglucanase